MINNKYKTIIIHIPKTGGTSIKKNIEGFNISGSHKNWNEEKKCANDLWDKYFKFSFIRNPWDWIYSIYSYYNMGYDISLVNPNMIPNTFEEFVYELDKYLTILGLNFNQSDFIGDELDFIGRFENFNEDFKYIITKLGLSNINLTHERKSIRKNDYHDVYNDKMIEIVKNKFIKDIEKYNYEY